MIPARNRFFDGKRYLFETENLNVFCHFKGIPLELTGPEALLFSKEKLNMVP